MAASRAGQGRAREGSGGAAPRDASSRRFADLEPRQRAMHQWPDRERERDGPDADAAAEQPAGDQDGQLDAGAGGAERDAAGGEAGHQPVAGSGTPAGADVEPRRDGGAEDRGDHVGGLLRGAARRREPARSRGRRRARRRARWRSCRGRALLERHPEREQRQRADHGHLPDREVDVLGDALVEHRSTGPGPACASTSSAIERPNSTRPENRRIERSTGRSKGPLMTRRRACVPRRRGVGDRFRGSAGPVHDHARADAVDEQRELGAERLGVGAARASRARRVSSARSQAFSRAAAARPGPGSRELRRGVDERAAASAIALVEPREPVEHGQRAALDRLQLLRPGRVPALEHRGHQLGLRAEVRVQRRLRDAGGADDVVDAPSRRSRPRRRAPTRSPAASAWPVRSASSAYLTSQ